MEIISSFFKQKDCCKFSLGKIWWCFVYLVFAESENEVGGHNRRSLSPTPYSERTQLELFAQGHVQEGFEYTQG